MRMLITVLLVLFTVLTLTVAAKSCLVSPTLVKAVLS